MKIIIVKCSSCENKKEVKEGEIKKDDFPMCDKCFMPMFPYKAIIKR